MKQNRTIRFNGITLITILTIFLFSSCWRASEKSTEKAIEKAIGSNADVNISKDKIVVETDEGSFSTDASANSWPDEIPSSVPEFKDGKIENVSTQKFDDIKRWVIFFEKVPDNAVKKYKTALEKKGFEIFSTGMMGTMGNITAENGNIIVTMMSEEGNATVSVNVED